MEVLSGSGDSRSLTQVRSIWTAIGVVRRLTRREVNKHKVKACGLEGHEQAMRTRQLASTATIGTSVVATVAFQSGTEKETAKPPLSRRWLCRSAVVENSAKVIQPH